MVPFFNIADLAFLFDQVSITNDPNGDPLNLIGTRNVDGSGNNLTHTVIIDQHGNSVDTDTFALDNQDFFHQYSTNIRAGLDGYVAGETNVDDTLANLLNGGMFGVFNDNYSIIGSVENPSGNVIDASPRVISNLIADMNPATNPAVASAPGMGLGNPGDPSLFILPFNSFFTFFGQFFDHGLDLINKGDAGTIAIPLLETDVNWVDPMSPAYVAGLSNVMYVTRGTINPITGLTTNSTAPLVEQSQTYGSSEAWKFYLQEYSDGTDGLAVGELTGRLVTGADGGMATWQDIIDNAAIKGIVLIDADINDIPEPIFNGGLTTYTKGAGTGKAFLVDIAHEANPNGQMGLKAADGDTAAEPDLGLGLFDGAGAPADGALFYDNELLRAHYIAGDSRVNENVVLTSIHEIFHNEHNRLLDVIKDLVAQQDQIEPGFAAQWDGARYFEAAKLINEMTYQHFVFEEFARRVSPNVTEFAQYDVTINPNITAEFSQAVYRLGHSMLTDNVGVVNAADQQNDTTLINAFLNPLLFGQTGAADFAEGATRVQGNQIDEFVVDALRNFLVGLPLDLAAINIARGRDVQLATLNEVRQDIFAQTADPSLAPYTTWNDFHANLLNPDSIVNFIAAYARRADFVAAREIGDNAAARALATAALTDATFMNGGDLGFWDIDLWIGGLAEAKVLGLGASPGMLGSTFDFIFAMQMMSLQNGDRLYYLARLAGTNILDQIEALVFSDLAERTLGITHLNGDIFGHAENYIELPTLGTPDRILVGPALNDDVAEVIGGGNLANTIDGGAGNDTIKGDAGDDIIRGGAGDDFLDGGDGDDTITDIQGDDFIRGGTGNDTVNAGVGFDVVFGQQGNDELHGGNLDDELFGGPGDDMLFGDAGADALFGQEGNDTLMGGIDDDALDGGIGDDYLNGGAGNDTLVGDVGDNVYDGGSGADAFDGLLGGYDSVTYQSSTMGLTLDMALGSITGDANGDTYIGIEELRGTPFNDAISGDAFDNVLVGGGAEVAGGDILDGRGGNDTLYGNAGLADNLQGGLGIDMAVYLGGLFADHTINVSAVGDGTITENGSGVTDVVTGIEQVAFDDGLWSTVTQEFVPLVGLSDSINLLIGGVDLDGNLVSTTGVDDNTPIPLDGITVARILVLDPDGIAEVGSRVVSLAGPHAASFKIIDVPVDTGTPGDIGKALQFMAGRAAGFSTANYEAQPDYKVTVLVDDASGGSAINYTLNINDVNDNRPVITSGTHVNVEENTSTSVVAYRVTSTDVDTVGPDVVYSLVAGPGGEDNADFNIVNGEVTFAASPDFEAPADADMDNIYNILVGAFDGVGPTTTQAAQIHVTDVAVEGANAAPSGAAVIIGAATEDQVLTVDTSSIGDPDGLGPFAYQWQRSTDGFATPGIVIPGATAAMYMLVDADVGAQVRVVVSFLDGGGTTESLTSGATAVVANVNDAPTGTPVITGITTEAEVLTADPSAIMDADGLGAFSYQWERSADGFATPGIVIPGATAAMYTLVAADVGQQVRVVVSYTDGGGTVESLTSAASTPVGAIGALFTEGDDTVILPAGGGEYFALGGNDDVTGGAGIDIIHGQGGNDTLRGEGNDDMLFGDAGTDMLFGGLGNDTLDGGAEADALRGEGGDDTYIVDSFGDLVFENAGEGIDTVQTGLSVYQLGANVENLVMLAGSTNGLGNNLANTITGSAAADVINGMAGADTMIGGLGNDNFFVDNIGDVVIENPGEGSDRVQTTVTLPVLFDNVEILTLLGGGDLDATGNTLDNVIFANAGINNIDGGAGNDLMMGGLGNDIMTGGTGGEADTMRGEAGDDTYTVDSIGDRVIENPGEGTNDSVFSSVSYTIDDNTENLTLTGVATISGTGGASANMITGNAGDNMLMGLGGADTLTGGAGNDVLVGGADADTYFFANGSGSDAINGFEAGAGAGDVAHIADFGFANFAAVQGAMSTMGADVLLTLDVDDFLLLRGHVIGDFAADDFILV